MESDFLKYLKDLEEEKPEVLCGDLNVAHTDIDLAIDEQINSGPRICQNNPV